jgi:hypothetical protein
MGRPYRRWSPRPSPTCRTPVRPSDPPTHTAPGRLRTTPHARAAGPSQLSAEQLEALRLQIAAASPVAAALDSARALTDAGCLRVVGEGVAEVLRTGVGLATLTHAARCVSALCVTPELAAAPCLGALSSLWLAPLLDPRRLSDPSQPLRDAFVTAAAHCARFCKASMLARLVDTLAALAGHGAPDAELRMATSLGPSAAERARISAAALARSLTQLAPQRVCRERYVR